VAVLQSKPKLHHYVPQFYLRQWCDANEQLVVYPIDGREPFRANPKNVAAECGLYSPLTEGLIDTKKGTTRECNDPIEVLNAVTELPEDSILLLRDFHQFFDDPNPLLVRRLKDQVRESRTTGKTLVVLGCRLNLPPELEREFTVIDIALPGFDELNAVLKGITESTEKPMPKPEAVSELIDAARGMTTTEA